MLTGDITPIDEDKTKKYVSLLQSSKITMKALYCILMLLLLGCNNNSNKKQETNNNVTVIPDDVVQIGRRYYPPSDYIPTKMSVYEVKEEYYPMFDSIVARAVSLPESRTKQVGFCFYEGLSMNDNDDVIRIYMVDSWCLDLDLENALFYYGGFRFNYFGKYLESMFTKGKNITLNKVDPKLYLTEQDDSGTIAIWSYIMKDDNVIHGNDFYIWRQY